MEHALEKVKIATADGEMLGYCALPAKGSAGAAAAGGKIRAVIVVQEAFGVNRHIQEVVKKVAHEGYIAIAPEFFHRVGEGVDLPYGDFSKVMPIFSQLTNASVKTDIQGTLTFLQERYKIAPENVAVMGFCMGGLAAMISATSQPIGAAVSYYGGGMISERAGIGFSPVIQDFKNIQCPLLLFFGDQDQSIPPSEIQAVENELKARGKTYELKVYAGAGHAFSNSDRPANYHEAATRDSWSRTLAWLKAL